MALIKIFEDVFDICSRIKEIDCGYFVVYNTQRKRYEIHHSGLKGSTFCIVCEDGLNGTVITKLRKSRIENIDKIMREMEENNQKLERENQRILQDETNFKLKEMFDYAQKRESDSNFDDGYKTSWV